MKKILIFGSGGHAKVILNEILLLKKYTFAGFIDKISKTSEIKINKKKFKVYPEDKIKKFKKIRAIIGVGDNKLRYKIYCKHKKNKNIIWEKIISKRSILQNDVLIGKGTFVMSGSMINCNSKIGNHCIVNSGAIVEHDNVFENFVSISPGACTGGNVKIGLFSNLGLGSIVKNNVKIGNNVNIGSLSFVNKNCLKKGIFIGIPAKKKN